jgi:hypothetical protein
LAIVLDKIDIKVESKLNIQQKPKSHVQKDNQSQARA